MHMLVMKNTANNTRYIVQELILFNNHLKFHYEAFYFHQCYHCILQPIYQLICFYIYNFYNLNILLCHMIYHIHTQNY